MFRIKKSFSVPVGHRLSKHDGRCKNIHGHNMKIEVQVSCHGLDNNDMVMDFSLLGYIVNSLLDQYDHATLLNSNDKKYIDFLKNCEDRRIVLIDNADPTAEVLSWYFYQSISNQLKARNQYLKLDYVAIWESDDAVAIYDGCEKDVK
jgi:6-pyruvoyltetrahydropterin/6-carboxytetrahydropterin synthase